MKKTKYGMPPPNSRIEFEHNIFMSIEMALQKLQNNQLDPHFIHVTLPKLRQIIYTPNKRIDFNSVDEELRLESNMLHWMELLPLPQIKEHD